MRVGGRGGEGRKKERQGGARATVTAILVSAVNDLLSHIAHCV